MSANRLSICPQCNHQQECKKIALLARAEEVYGKAPSNVYQKIVADAHQAAVQAQGDTTLEETWECGIIGGEFYFDYGARCRTCGFLFVASMKKTVPIT